MPDRMELLHAWLSGRLGLKNYVLAPASEDASFRRYFRLQYDGLTRIVMDAPPAQEDIRPFIDITGRLKACRVHVPDILERDMDQGFLLLTDLGSTLYLHVLTDGNAGQLYADALAALAAIQWHGETRGLPPYDEALLMQEMHLFRDWLVGKHLGLRLDRRQQAGLRNVFRMLADAALAQPTVFVHRDYHSRNLMYCEQHNPGIVDYQDAVAGPLTYDLVSLLKDCYIKWPRQKVIAWALDYRRRVHPECADEAGFLRWFDLMGVQRHLKASGIFARLFLRDGKRGFLDDIPRTLSYIVELDGEYPELAFLAGFVSHRVLPAFAALNGPCAP